jgi:hypothetical protein
VIPNPSAMHRHLSASQRRGQSEMVMFALSNRR